MPHGNSEREREDQHTASEIESRAAEKGGGEEIVVGSSGSLPRR